MSIITILLFFIYTWGLGFSATYFAKQAENFFERNIMRIGIGLGIFPILSIAMNFLHIPLDWKIFLVLSLAMPLYSVYRNRGIKKPEIDLRLTRTNMRLIIVLLLFFFSFYMYHKGSFIYPWFEDSDPWLHAEGVEYISIEKTAYQPYTGGQRYLVYSDPYPPSYDIMLAVLHQTSPELMWTMKFFNALIISLGIIFFYFFAKQLMGDANKALFAAFVLAMVPSYLSHFIWAHALGMTILFPCLYALERIEIERKWMYAAMPMIASLFVIAPTLAVKFALFFAIYFAVKSALNRKFLKEIFIAGVAGFLLSMLWWGAMLFRYKGLSAIAGVMGGEDIVAKAAGTGLLAAIQKVFNPASGSATRAYTFNDYFIAKSQNMINNPVGLGIFITILLALGVIYVIVKRKRLMEKENHWLLISLCLLVYTFLGVNSMTFNLPIGLHAFRFWMIQAVAVSLLCAAGLWFLLRIAGAAGIGKILIVAVVVSGVVFTSGIQKYRVNTALWMAPDIVPQDALQGKGFVWLKTLPTDTAVFSFQGTGYIQSFDKYSCDWCSDVTEFRKGLENSSAEEIYSFLKSKNYEYALVDSWYANKAGINRTNEQLNEIANSGLFTPVHQATGIVIFRVK